MFWGLLTRAAEGAKQRLAEPGVSQGLLHASENRAQPARRCTDELGGCCVAGRLGYRRSCAFKCHALDCYKPYCKYFAFVDVAGVTGATAVGRAA